MASDSVKKGKKAADAKPEAVSIPKIAQQFGSKNMTITVRVYDSKEALERMELPQIVFRNRGEKRKAKKKEKPKKNKFWS